MSTRGHDAGRALAARSRFLWTVSPPTVRGTGRVLFSLATEWQTELPEAPFVVAANHYSHFDSPVIAAVLDRRVRYLALEDLFAESRLLNWLIVGFGAIPTPRHRLPIGAVRAALAALEAGEVVGVFPEGARVSHWGTIPPKRGAAWLAARAGVPLVPVAVIGSGRAFGLDNRAQRAPIRVIVGEALQPSGEDVDGMMRRWSEWISAQIARHPGSEVVGPPRSLLD